MSFTGPPSFTPPSYTEPPSFINARNNQPVSMQYKLYTGPPSFTSPSFINARNNNSSEGFMDPIPRDLDHCRIPLEDIIKATNNFAEENIIEKDYKKTVYKGELSGKKLAFTLVNEGYCIWSIDRVVKFSSLPKHQNVVSVIGYCDEDGKSILVFEHPIRGSLDKYVSSTAHLTWLMRVQICIDIASGLHYLSENHSEIRTAYLNSASIYLDENWQAKIELIKPAEMIDRDIASGCAPSFSATVRLSSYSTSSNKDAQKLHSLGEIQFELLCGRLAVTEDEGERYLGDLAREHYEKGTLIEIIDPVLRGQMNHDSFVVFSELAYACLDWNQNMSGLEEELEKVLRLQQGSEISELQQFHTLNPSSLFCPNLLRDPLLTVLICEYLDWAQLGHTLKVYFLECNLQKDAWKAELRDFSNKNGYDINKNGCCWMYLKVSRNLRQL